MELFLIFIARWLIYIVLGIAIIAAYFKWGRRVTLVVLGSALGSFISAFILKFVFNVPRPYVTLHEITPLLTFDPSFPSAHTALLAGLGLAIFFKNKFWGGVILVVALIVGATRVILQVHYPIDIFGGAVVGVAVGLFINYWPKIKNEKG